MEAKHTTKLRLCGAKRGGCDCRQIWNGEGNALVAVALEAADENYTGGEGYTKEAAKANADEIAHRWNTHAQLIAALEKIADPITAMKKGLKPGEIINGYYAVQLAKDPEYLKEIARAALALARGEKE